MFRVWWVHYDYAKLLLQVKSSRKVNFLSHAFPRDAQINRGERDSSGGSKAQQIYVHNIRQR